MEDEVGPAAPDEDRVAEAVEVLDCFGRDGFLAGESDQQAFGSAADGAGDVEFGVETAAAGEDEAAEGRDVFVHGVDLAFELFDFDVGDAGLAGMDVFGTGGEDGAEIEELMLDAAQDRGEQAHAGIDAAEILAGDAGQADEGVQFVDGAVGFDAEGVFGDALASGEAGFTGVAALGVDAVQREAGVIEGFFAHAFIVCVWENRWGRRDSEIETYVSAGAGLLRKSLTNFTGWSRIQRSGDLKRMFHK